MCVCRGRVNQPVVVGGDGCRGSPGHGEGAGKLHKLSLVFITASAELLKLSSELATRPAELARRVSSPERINKTKLAK